LRASSTAVRAISMLSNSVTCCSSRNSAMGFDLLC
jgi:hypothetical protein